MRLVDHGGRVAAEHLGHRRAEHGVALAGGVVAGGEHPAVGQGVVADVGVVGRGADDLQVAVLVAVHHLLRLLRLGHDGLEQRGVPLERLVVVGAEHGAVGDHDRAAPALARRTR